MKPRSQSIFVSFCLPVLVVSVTVGLSGCNSMVNRGGPADGRSAMLQDLDGKAAAHALVSPQETPVFMESGEKRTAAMLIDLDRRGVMMKEAAPVRLEEQKPATAK